MSSILHEHFRPDRPGHSLLATRLVARLVDVFAVDITLRDFFEAPTVARIARHLVHAELSAARS